MKLDHCLAVGAAAKRNMVVNGFRKTSSHLG